MLFLSWAQSYAEFKINPTVGMVVICLYPALWGYGGGFLHSKALIGWSLGSLF